MNMQGEWIPLPRKEKWSQGQVRAGCLLARENLTPRTDALPQPHGTSTLREGKEAQVQECPTELLRLTQTHPHSLTHPRSRNCLSPTLTHAA